MELTQKDSCKRKAGRLPATILPQFDIPAATQRTLEAPEWVHFGAGNIFRAFQANVAQCLLNQGIMSTGLIAAEGYDYEIIEKCTVPTTILVSRHPEGRRNHGENGSRAVLWNP